MSVSTFKIAVILYLFLLLADLNTEGQEYIVAEGGPGGHPGNSFLGRRGEIKTVSLVLKLIADIGLVGWVLDVN